MKVFYAVQVSNNNGKKWLLRNDACMNIAVGIVKCLMEEDPSIEVALKCPPPEDCADVVDVYDDFFGKEFLEKHDKQLQILYDSIPISPIYSRFNFDFSDYMKHRDRFEDIDVMINDENTLTKNWNALFHAMNLNIPIVSTNYFLDSPSFNKVDQKVRYYERQMESFINSDIAAFQCEAGKQEAMEAYDVLYKSRQPLAKQSVWGVGVHAAEIQAYQTTHRNVVPEIYFGNRITETADRYTNWHVYAEAIGIASKNTNKLFVPFMLNPTRKVTTKQLKEINKLSYGQMVVKRNDEKFTREDYLEFINKADISCNLFTTEVHGGVTHCEALLSNNIVIMPRINNYKEKFEGWELSHNKQYPFFCGYDEKPINKPIDVNSLADKIVEAVEMWNSDEEIYWKSICNAVGYNTESYERAAVRIIEDLKYLVENK
jgi:hypothetical protein